MGKEGYITIQPQKQEARHTTWIVHTFKQQGLNKCNMHAPPLLQYNLKPETQSNLRYKPDMPYTLKPETQKHGTAREVNLCLVTMIVFCDTCFFCLFHKPGGCGCILT